MSDTASKTDHGLSSAERQACEDPLLYLDQGRAALCVLWDSVAHGTGLSEQTVANAIHFIERSMERDIDALRDALRLPR